MDIDYNAIGISNEMVSKINTHATFALGECVLLLIMQEVEINKENLLSTLMSEIEQNIMTPTADIDLLSRCWLFTADKQIKSKPPLVNDFHEQYA